MADQKGTGVHPHSGQKYYIKNVGLGKNLSMSNDGVKLSLSPNFAAWEEFFVENAGAGKVFIKSAAHGKQISGHPDKVIGSPNTQDWEKLTLSAQDNAVYFIHDHHGKQIAGDAKDGIIPSPNKKEWETWSFIPAGFDSRRKYVIHNVQFKKNISLTPDDKVVLSPNSLAWEKFFIETHGDKIVIKSAEHKGKQLSGHPDKFIGSPNVQDWEKFKVESAGNGNYYIINHHGKQAGGTDKDVVIPSPNKKEWEVWRFIPDAAPVPGHKYYIKNIGLNKTLSLDGGEKVYLSDNYAAWEQWTVSDAGNGKVIIKNATHGKHLSGHPDKVIGSPNTQDWEKLTLKPVVGGAFVIGDHHGKNIGGTADGSVKPTANALAWEHWIFISA